eukprot:GSMAST32.ASY1.ANO1.1427.1 assembled CDS
MNASTGLGLSFGLMGISKINRTRVFDKVNNKTSRVLNQNKGIIVEAHRKNNTNSRVNEGEKHGRKKSKIPKNKTRHTKSINNNKTINIGQTNIEFWQATLINLDVSTPRRRRALKLRIRKGISDPLRGAMWAALTGGDELLWANPGQYKAYSTMKSPHTAIITRDISRTFPKHQFFRDSGGVPLYNILCAYSVHDPDVGYCQGMGYIAGIFLCYMPEENAFWMLDSIMKSHDMKGIFREGLPKFNIELGFFFFFFFFFLTYNFSFDAVRRIWDCFLAEGWTVVFRVSLALLQMIEDGRQFWIQQEFAQNTMLNNENDKYTKEKSKTKISRPMEEMESMGNRHHHEESCKQSIQSSRIEIDPNKLDVANRRTTNTNQSVQEKEYQYEETFGFVNSAVDSIGRYIWGNDKKYENSWVNHGKNENPLSIEIPNPSTKHTRNDRNDTNSKYKNNNLTHTQLDTELFTNKKEYTRNVPNTRNYNKDTSDNLQSKHEWLFSCVEGTPFDFEHILLCLKEIPAQVVPNEIMYVPIIHFKFQFFLL